MPPRAERRPISVNSSAAKNALRSGSGSTAKNSAMPMGMPSRMRFSAPTEGFTRFASISEIAELVTPARLARVRCDRP